MATAVIVGVLVVVWLVAIVRFQPRDASPAASVDHQHRALQALHEATERSRHGRAPTSGASLHASTGHTAAMRSVPDGATLLPVPSGADPITRRPGLRRPLTAVGLAVALAGAGVAVNAVVASRSSGSSSRPVATAAPRGTTDRATQGRAGRAKPTEGTVTTAAPRPTTSVVSTDARRAEVVVAVASAAGTYRLTVAATSGRCWVQVSAASGGTGAAGTILAPGQASALDVTGPATVRLGNAAAVTFSVDGQAVALPQLPAGAFQVDLRPGAAS